MKPAELHYFIDPNRCIGCQARESNTFPGYASQLEPQQG